MWNGTTEILKQSPASRNTRPNTMPTLPAFTAALLGATSIRPGRVNVWGTVLAVAVLAVTVAGLNQLGAPFFVEPLFNGAMLILAVGLAVQASQRRSRRGSEADRAATAASAAKKTAQQESPR